MTLAGALAVAALLPREKQIRALGRPGRLWPADAARISRIRNCVATYAVGFGMLFNFIAHLHLYQLPSRRAALQSVGRPALGAIFVVYLVGSALTPLAGWAIGRFGRRRFHAARSWPLGCAASLLTLAGAAVADHRSVLPLCAGCGLICQAISTGYVTITAKAGRSSAVGLYVTASISAAASAPRSAASAGCSAAGPPASPWWSAMLSRHGGDHLSSPGRRACRWRRRRADRAAVIKSHMTGCNRANAVTTPRSLSAKPKPNSCDRSTRRRCAICWRWWRRSGAATAIPCGTCTARSRTCRRWSASPRPSPCARKDRVPLGEAGYMKQTSRLSRLRRRGAAAGDRRDPGPRRHRRLRRVLGRGAVERSQSARLPRHHHQRLDPRHPDDPARLPDAGRLDRRRRMPSCMSSISACR